jgi:hypothetical protein
MRLHKLRPTPRFSGSFDKGTISFTLTGGKAGLRIVGILEAAQESIQNQGARVLLLKRPALAAA